MLLSLSTDGQEEIAETLTSITRHKQNVEGDGQAEHVRCDEQTCEREINSHDHGESTAALVEDQTPRSLERAPWGIVDGLYNEISTREGNRVPKGFDELLSK